MSWNRSSRSNGNGGACVEVALAPELAGVRDSKDRDGGALVFARGRWNAFLAGIKK